MKKVFELVEPKSITLYKEGMEDGVEKNCTAPSEKGWSCDYYDDGHCFDKPKNFLCKYPKKRAVILDPASFETYEVKKGDRIVTYSNGKKKVVSEEMFQKHFIELETSPLI